MPNFLLANAQSLINKIDELEQVINQNNIDIACITETWLNKDVISCHIDNYTTYRNDRSDGRGGGGVLCFVRNDLPCSRLSELESSSVESLWILFRANRMPRAVSHIVVGIIYHPPNVTAEYSRNVNSHILDCLDRITSVHQYTGIVLLGDFNQLKDSSIISFPLKQVVKRATRGARILDKIYTNIAQWYNQPTVLPPLGKSDHNVVLLTECSVITSDRSNRETVTVTVRSRDRNGKILLAHALRNFNWIYLYQMEKCEDMLNYFYKITRQLLDTFLPLRSVKINKRDKPWVNDSFRYLIRRRQYAWTHQRWEEYRIYRNRVQRAVLFLRSRYYNRRVQGLRQSNPRKWWQEVKRFTGQSTRPSFDAMATDLFDGDLIRMANNINIFMQSVSNDLKPLDVNLIPDACDACPDEYIIDPFEVESKLSRINSHKSNGPDELPNWFLKEFSVFLAEPVCSIFNASIREGEVPSVWKLANVVPIPKVSPPKAISTDIRPISLTPTLSKIIESFIGKWVLDHI